MSLLDEATVSDEAVHAALGQAIEWSFDQQESDGHWVAECHANVTLTAEYIFIRQICGFTQDNAEAFRCWILSQQNSDGSWGIAVNFRGDVSSTTEAYLALKILGVQADAPCMLRARDFVLQHGGCEKVRFLTRFFLASFGTLPWPYVPQLPAELILAPSWFPVNIYALSYWARVTLVPLICLRQHERIYALPNGYSSNNNFIDELWCDPVNKIAPYVRPITSILREGELAEAGFTMVDKVLALVKLSKVSPLNEYARKKCVEWIVRHFEPSGHVGGIFPPVLFGAWTLWEEGYSLEHQIIRQAFVAMESFCISDDHGKRAQSTTSPVWDTVLMQYALCGEGALRSDPRVRKTHDWILKMQLPAEGTEGDWRVYKPKLNGGGWVFQYHNLWYPDVDDTAVAVMALIKFDPLMCASEAVARAVSWMLGMQNPDGGWAAFEWNNHKQFLNKIPFNDTKAFCDPSTADITGRLLECFGLLLSFPESQSMSPVLHQQIQVAIPRAIKYILKIQESDGSWWGRWGCNYIYGSSNVMRGISYFMDENKILRQAASRCISWFRERQNADGGWGECLESYDNAELAGRGLTTASQTAWAIQAMLPFCLKTDAAIQKGVKSLLNSQTVASMNGMSWAVDAFTGTGFPGTFYLCYPLYEHFFPIMALTKFLETPGPSGAEYSTPLPISLADSLSRPDILLMTIGSYGDVTASLEIAKALQRQHDCRIRFATSPIFKDLVKQQLGEVDFHSVEGDPMSLVRYRAENDHIIPSWKAIRNGKHFEITKIYHDMMAGFWSSCVTKTSGLPTEKKRERPFFPDLIISNTNTLVHVHCAELLNAPLLLVSLQPRWLTSEYLHFMAYSSPKLNHSKAWKRVSHLIFEIFMWLLVGSPINHLRRQHGMTAVSWLTIAVRTMKMNIPHVGLWSSSVMPRPNDCSSEEQVVGFTYTSQNTSRGLNDFIPSRMLEEILNDNNPVVAVTFGSQPLAKPNELLRIIREGCRSQKAKLIVFQGWSQFEENLNDPNVLFVRNIPHDWLFPRVTAVIHHASSGTTAIAMKSGTVMLCIPFMLDQHMWAAHAHRLGLGPAPIRIHDLTDKVFQAALGRLLSNQYKINCSKLAAQLRFETDGGTATANIGAAILQENKRHMMCCAVLPELKAIWKHRSLGICLSGVAASSLVGSKRLQWSHLEAISTKTGLLPSKSNWRRQLMASLVQVVGSCMAMAMAIWMSVTPEIIIFLTTIFVVTILDAVSVSRTAEGVTDEAGPRFRARVERSYHDLDTVKEHIMMDCHLSEKSDIKERELRVAFWEDRVVQVWEELRRQLF